MSWRCYFCKIDLGDEVAKCECGSIRPREKDPRPVPTEVRWPEIQPPVPLARQCPKCDGRRYRRVRPQARVAFVMDRVCLDCGARYSPPTPTWAAVVFVTAGILLAGVGLLDLLLLAGSRNTCAVPSMIVDGFLIAGGVLAVRHGVLSMTGVRQVVDTTAGPNEPNQKPTDT